MRAIAHCLRATTYCPTPFYLQLTAHHTPAQVAERRKLEAQEAALAQNAKWQRQHAMQARSISRAVGGAIKAEQMMMLSSAASRRQDNEMLDLMQMAKPFHERHGNPNPTLTPTLTRTLTLTLTLTLTRRRTRRRRAGCPSAPR